LIPLPAQFDTDCDIIVETDASHDVSVAVLSQYDDDEILHLVKYFPKKPSAMKSNSKIYDQELITIIHGVIEWRPKLQSVINPIYILLDNRNLDYPTRMRLLNMTV
jgi:hypothetical protein